MPALIPQEKPLLLEKVSPVAIWEVLPALTARFPPPPPPPIAEAVTDPLESPKVTLGLLANAGITSEPTRETVTA